MTGEEFLESFRPLAVGQSPGGEFYLGLDDTLEFVRAAATVAIAVIGVDSFNISPGCHQSMGYSLYRVEEVYDRSWPEVCRWCAEQAREFIQSEAHHARHFSLVTMAEFEATRPKGP